MQNRLLHIERWHSGFQSAARQADYFQKARLRLTAHSLQHPAVILGFSKMMGECQVHFNGFLCGSMI